MNIELIREETKLNYNAESRKIYLCEEVDMDTPIFVFDRIARIIDQTKSHDPITLVISSPGGDIYGLLGVIDVINEASVKINTHIIGSAMSAAAWIAMCATGTRTMGKLSFIMLHQVQAMIGGSTDAVASENKHLKEVQEVLYEILSSRTKKPVKWWNTATKQNLYINYTKALELGLIDS